MKKIILIFVCTQLVFLMSSPFRAHAKSGETQKNEFHLNSIPDVDSWGFDVGFGSQPYMEDVSRVGLLTPFLFEGGRQTSWRISFDFIVKTLQAFNADSITEFALSLESNGKIYKDVVYSFVKFGVGAMTLDDDLYDGIIFTLPVSLGLQVIVANTSRGVLSYFIEHKFAAYKDYDIKKSLPSQSTVGIDKSALFSGTTSVGIRFTF